MINCSYNLINVNTVTKFSPIQLISNLDKIWLVGWRILNVNTNQFDHSFYESTIHYSCALAFVYRVFKKYIHSLLFIRNETRYDRIISAYDLYVMYIHVIYMHMAYC